jgi:serine/threonine-protein phosphatase PP1 catalytic subunit
MKTNGTEFDIDDIINKLTDSKKYHRFKQSLKNSKHVFLSEAEIKWLCIQAKEIFLEQPAFLELFSPLNLCGKNILT